MKTIDKNVLQTIIEKLVQEFHPVKVILFGSHVWGTPSEDSDLDILVVVKASKLTPTRRAARGYHCLKNFRVPVEIFVNTEDELKAYSSVVASLTHKILEKGKIMYG